MKNDKKKREGMKNDNEYMKFSEVEVDEGWIKKYIHKQFSWITIRQPEHKETLDSIAQAIAKAICEGKIIRKVK